MNEGKNLSTTGRQQDGTDGREERPTWAPWDGRCWCGNGHGRPLTRELREEIRYSLGLPPLDPYERRQWYGERRRRAWLARKYPKRNVEFEEWCREIGWTSPATERREREEGRLLRERWRSLGLFMPDEETLAKLDGDGDERGR